MKNNDKMILPKIRFKEFKDIWKIRKLADATSDDKYSFTGGPFGSDLKSKDFTDEGVFVIQLQNIGDGIFVDEYKTFTSVNKANELLSCNIYPGEIIISKMGDPVGRACIIPNTYDRYVMCSDGIRFVTNCKGFNNNFMFQLINSKQIRTNIESKSTGSTRKRIGLDTLRNINICIPELSEQKKIADCLTSLDDLINAENKKLELLKEHKKGLMQKLFPAEGDAMPEWRFPEFKDSGEWELEKYKKYIKLYRGSSPRPIQNYTTNRDGVAWIKIGDTKNAKGFKLYNTEEKITIEGAKKSRFVDVGELILANSMSYGKTYEMRISGYIYDGWFVLREYEEYFQKDFLLQQLNSDRMQLQYISLSAGGIVQNISSDIVYSTFLNRPQKIEEQKKIADCLSSIDRLIEEQAKKIEQLKEHKRGLMQGLFPSLEEVE